MEIKRQKYCLVGKEIKLQDWALRENMFSLVLLLLLVCSGEGAIQSQVIEMIRSVDLFKVFLKCCESYHFPFML